MFSLSKKKKSLGLSYVKGLFANSKKMRFSGPSSLIMRQSAKNMKLGSSSALFFRYAEVLLFINCFNTFEDTSVKIVVLALELEMCHY